MVSVVTYIENEPPHIKPLPSLAPCACLTARVGYDARYVCRDKYQTVACGRRAPEDKPKDDTEVHTITLAGIRIETPVSINRASLDSIHIQTPGMTSYARWCPDAWLLIRSDLSFMLCWDQALSIHSIGGTLGSKPMVMLTGR